MATKSKAHAPAKVQPAAQSDCPIEVAGPSRSRVDLANSACWQIHALLNAAVPSLSSFARDDEDLFVILAIVTRAQRLAAAAATLLSDPDAADAVAHAKTEVWGSEHQSDEEAEEAQS